MFLIQSIYNKISHFIPEALTSFYKLNSKSKYEFKNKITITNIIRLKWFSITLLVINILMTIFDFGKFFCKEPQDFFYNMIASRIFISIFLVFSIALLIEFSKNISRRTVRTFNIFLPFYILTIMSWVIFLYFNSIESHGQVSAYIICIFSTSIILILTPLQTSITFASSLLILYILIPILSDWNIDTIASFRNSAYAILISYFSSIFNYVYNIRIFLSELELTEKNKSLNSYKAQLEVLISKQKEDLDITSSKLLDEVDAKNLLENEILESKKHMEHLTEFFANISHELKTPLNIIYSAQQMLYLSYKNTESLNSNSQEKNNYYLYMIKQNCFRLTRLIGNLIDISKADSGFLKPKLINDNIIDITENITLSIAEYCESKNITLVFDTIEEERIIAFDPESIERIMLNLLSNAIKFTPENGEIRVTIISDDDIVKIIVEDTGLGIPMECQKIIFNRFAQAQNCKSINKQGSGIGLSLVHSLVSMHNGTIELESEVNKGSKFIITLPCTITEEEYPHTNSNLRCNSDSIVDMVNIELSEIYLKE